MAVSSLPLRCMWLGDIPNHTIDSNRLKTVRSKAKRPAQTIGGELGDFLGSFFYVFNALIPETAIYAFFLLSFYYLNNTHWL